MSTPATSLSRQRAGPLAASRLRSLQPLSDLEFGPGSVADHAAVHLFLQGVFQRPSLTEYQAQLERPAYLPSDRLLAKDHGEIVGHIRLTPRAMRWNGQWLRASFIEELAVGPEYRRRGCGSLLLQLAEDTARAEGSELAIVRTDLPRFFLRQGWSEGPCWSFSEIAPRRLMPGLELDSAPDDESITWFRPRTQQPPAVRLWRQMERDAIMRRYQVFAARHTGGTQRNADYWQWLLSRRGFERIYVAVAAAHEPATESASKQCLGYAATRYGRILELVSEPEAATGLLRRVCEDAIEQGHHTVRLDAPPDSPLHEAFVRSGGVHYCQGCLAGTWTFVKLLHAAATLERLRPELWDRARRAGLSQGSELGLLVGSEKFVLHVGPRSLRLHRGRLGRSYLQLAPTAFARVLLGLVDVTEAVAAGSISASTRIAQELSRIFFPAQSPWLPPWDDVHAVL